jgi:hypothetical protein
MMIQILVLFFSKASLDGPRSKHENIRIIMTATVVQYNDCIQGGMPQVMQKSLVKAFMKLF